ncbi:MAG: hypothetical protein ACXAC7_22750, partial [Candidatus Hodarchaeales archaeon]
MDFKKEFKVNEYITLKLEQNRTFIYVAGRRFLQCKRLMINILEKDIPKFDEIDSIDEAADVYEQFLWENRIVEGPMARPSAIQNETITPEQEFWGHCSNIQSWVENNYNTRLLHSNLAFPLLKKLVDAGDERAKRMLKVEIMERLESGHPNVIISILSAGLSNYLSPEEKRQVFLESLESGHPNVIIVILSAGLLNYFDEEEKRQLLQQSFPFIIEIIGSSEILICLVSYIFRESLLEYLSPEEKAQLEHLNYPIL